MTAGKPAVDIYSAERYADNRATCQLFSGLLRSMSLSDWDPTGHVQESFVRYMQLLRSLHDMGSFGELAIYPAVGVDCFAAQHCKLIGLNLWRYDISTIIQE